MSSKHARLGRFLASARTRAALSLGLVLAVGSTGTFAYWTDDVTVTGTTFTAGTLDLQVNNLNSVAAYTALNLDKMVPGNSMAGTLVIKNNGNVPLKYTAAAVGVNADSAKNLAGSLTAKVTTGGTTGSSPTITCTGTTIAGSGTTVNGSLISTGRQLAPGATETICVEVTLPANAPNSLQGAKTDVTFTFTGTSDLS
jgi:predicted ribosomally synthesized peptide with SipW-like signal peptide